MSLICSPPHLKHAVKASFRLVNFPAAFHLRPLQKAMHSQLPASDEVKHIQSAAHYSFYYHKCQQSSSSLSLLLQCRKCQMHLRQWETSDGPEAQLRCTITTLITHNSTAASRYILEIDINTIFISWRSSKNSKKNHPSSNSAVSKAEIPI